MKLKSLLLTMLAAVVMVATAQTPVAHYDMSLSGNAVKELISNQSYTVASQLPACTVEAMNGQALRFDGYSNYVRGGLPIASLSDEQLTLQVVLAAEAYPMMQTASTANGNVWCILCGNLDETNKKGFALQLSSDGRLQLKTYVAYNAGGAAITLTSTERLPRGKWCQVTMTFDKANNAVGLYLNGTLIASKKNNRCSLRHSDTDFMIGKEPADVREGMFLLNTFCGAIDDIAIYNDVIAVPVNVPVRADLAYPALRYEQGTEALWRPLFHAMPSGSWTNESHGMLFSGGKWHIFSQKNPNGPYMYRLHWGHNTSTDLCSWHEEPIAIGPDETFDKDGCWSGCVYEDGGNTYILYTAVGQGAKIAQARATDNTLIEWTDKRVVIDGQRGLDEDFRDPYYFEANGQKYIIVGGKKGGMGCATLHKWNGSSWSNDGKLFFKSTNAAQYGVFWEMPNVTPLNDGKYLFTCTPQGLSTGVRNLCWVGTIGTDGTFTPDGGIDKVQTLEMGGIGKDGYGLLSPTIGQFGNQTLLLGIVPDKISTEDNARMGWAHTFSLPRQISIDGSGQLVQKPYDGLTALRSSVSYSQELSLNGSQSLTPVSGNHIELLGEFTVGTSGYCGFRFLKSGNKMAQLRYNVATGALTLTTSTLNRVKTDNGTWTAILPEKVGNGQKLKLHVFLDGSIADIFVNDRWAFSTRIFSTDASQVEAEVLTANATMPVNVQAWVLDGSNSGSTGIYSVSLMNDEEGIMNNSSFTNHYSLGQGPHTVYDLQGRRLASVPQKGLYIRNGKKYIIQ